MVDATVLVSIVIDPDPRKTAVGGARVADRGMKAGEMACQAPNITEIIHEKISGSTGNDFRNR